MKLMGLVLAAILSTCAVAAPDSGRLPPILRSGLTAYKADGAQAAINAWIIGSPIAMSEQPQREVRALRRLEEQFGAYQDFHVVRVVAVSPTTEIVYLQLDYLRGPGFGKFLVYQTKDAWNVVTFAFGDDPEVVWGVLLFGAPDTL